MADEKPRIMRGAIEEVIVSIDDDCVGHTCYLSIGDAKKCFVTVTQRAIVPTDAGCEIVFSLTQEDTLACKAGKWSMQMRTVEDETAAFATEWIPVEIGEAINKEVLEDVD